MKGAYCVADEELTVAPLTAEELARIKKLQRVLAFCPDRLQLMTIGDASLRVIDGEGSLGSALADGAAMRDGIVLATVAGKPIVHGVSG